MTESQIKALARHLTIDVNESNKYSIRAQALNISYSDEAEKVRSRVRGLLGEFEGLTAKWYNLTESDDLTMMFNDDLLEDHFLKQKYEEVDSQQVEDYITLLLMEDSTISKKDVEDRVLSYYAYD